jgi:transposase
VRIQRSVRIQGGTKVLTPVEVRIFVPPPMDIKDLLNPLLITKGTGPSLIPFPLAHDDKSPSKEWPAIRASILALGAQNVKCTYIASRTGCSESTVKRTLKKRAIFDAPRCGRPPKLTNRAKEAIREHMEDKWGASLRSTAKAINRSEEFRAAGATISHVAIHRYLRTTDWGKTSFRADRKPLLTEKNIADRLAFCRLVQTEKYCDRTNEGLDKLHHILFTDEAPICLNAAPNRQNCRIRTLSPEKRIVCLPKNTVTVMVAGEMTFNGLTDLHIVDRSSTVNGDYYRRNIVPIYASTSASTPNGLFSRRELITFQQDGAPAHTAKETMELLHANFPFVWGKGV